MPGDRIPHSVLPSREIGTLHMEISMIYVVEEQQADWLFASLIEARAFDLARADQHRHAEVVLYDHKRHGFKEHTCLEFGPGQEKCRRLRRKIHQWWKARDEWWNHSTNY